MRPLRATMLLSSVALALSGCATFDDDDVAARVGDAELTFDQVADVLGDDARNAALVRELVGQFTLTEALRADLAALGIETPQVELDGDVRSDIAAAFDFNVQNWQTVPAAQLADAATQTAYESGEAPIACLAHVLTETEAEATAAFDRLAGGERFADVAAGVSVDPGSAARGGSLGCLPETAIAATFVDGFADAAADVGVGEVIGPAETEFGFHLVTRMAFADLDQTQLLQLRLSRFPDRYDIEIDPKVGQWSGFGEIVPLG